VYYPQEWLLLHLSCKQSLVHVQIKDPWKPLPAAAGATCLQLFRREQHPAVDELVTAVALLQHACCIILQALQCGCCLLLQLAQ
jgi:hypothetical protein